MKLLIDIPKEKYEWIKAHNLNIDNDSIVGAVANGTPYEERPQGKWINAEERLPEEMKQVLVWYEYYRYGEYNRMYKTYGIGFYDSTYDMWCGDIRGHKAKVLAWMPLPEPYKGAK